MGTWAESALRTIPAFLKRETIPSVDNLAEKLPPERWFLYSPMALNILFNGGHRDGLEEATGLVKKEDLFVWDPDPQVREKIQDELATRDCWELADIHYLGGNFDSLSRSIYVELSGKRLLESSQMSPHNLLIISSNLYQEMRHLMPEMYLYVAEDTSLEIQQYPQYKEAAQQVFTSAEAMYQRIPYDLQVIKMYNKSMRRFLRENPRFLNGFAPLALWQTDKKAARCIREEKKLQLDQNMRFLKGEIKRLTDILRDKNFGQRIRTVRQRLAVA